MLFKKAKRSQAVSTVGKRHHRFEKEQRLGMSKFIFGEKSPLYSTSRSYGKLFGQAVVTKPGQRGSRGFEGHISSKSLWENHLKKKTKKTHMFFSFFCWLSLFP